MVFREAQPGDIREIQMVRNAVRENALSNPNLVSDQDCLMFLFERGKGWVCEIESLIIGFAIVDFQENIWTLFLKPEFEGQGIGTKLQKMM